MLLGMSCKKGGVMYHAYLVRYGYEWKPEIQNVPSISNQTPLLN